MNRHEIAAALADAAKPLCSRCEELPPTDDDLCAGCHDAVGEAQDERAARSV